MVGGGDIVVRARGEVLKDDLLRLGDRLVDSARGQGFLGLQESESEGSAGPSGGLIDFREKAFRLPERGAGGLRPALHEVRPGLEHGLLSPVKGAELWVPPRIDGRV